MRSSLASASGAACSKKRKTIPDVLILSYSNAQLTERVGLVLRLMFRLRRRRPRPQAAAAQPQAAPIQTDRGSISEEAMTYLASNQPENFLAFLREDTPPETLTFAAE